MFSVTYADPDSVPSEGLSEAMSAAMLREGRDLAQYPPPQGHVGMRELIAQRLGERRKLETSPDSIFLSGGAAGAIQTMLDAFIDPGDIVLVERVLLPGHPQHTAGAKGAGRTRPDGRSRDGYRRSRDDCQELGVQGPTAQDDLHHIGVSKPTGVTLSLDRRKHMLQIANRYGIPILENESYADFRIDGEELPPSIMGMDDQDSGMYVSAYTKLLGCGLRLGYGVFPEPLRDTLTQLEFGVSPSHLAAMAVHEYLRNHADEYVADVTASLRAKRDAMLAALGENFPPACDWNSPEGRDDGLGSVCPRAPTHWPRWQAAVEADVKYNPGLRLSS